MAHYDPSNTASHITLLKGTYVCKVEKITENTSEHGDRWNIWFRIIEGEHERWVIFDDIYFYGKGMKHAGIFLAALGRNPSDKQEILRKDVLDLTCRIDVDITTFEHEGKTKKKNIVLSYNFSSIEDDPPF